MVVEQAISVIGQSLELASKHGAFGISDSAIIKTAYDLLVAFVNENSPKEEPTEEKEVK